MKVTICVGAGRGGGGEGWELWWMDLRKKRVTVPPNHPGGVANL